MAQKRTDYSKFTRSNGTVLVLALWASLALHLVTGSNLDKVGLTSPVKVKPAGGTVRVVDLTPAEQTRVPEAAKSRPLPIAPTPANPEIATRATSSPLPSRNSGVSTFLPPRNRPQLPPPSTQVPSNQPVVPTNPNSKKPELSNDPRNKRFSQEGGSENDKGESGDNTGRRKKKESQPDKDDKSQVNESESEQEKIDRKDKEKKDQQERDEKKRKDKEKKDQEEREKNKKDQPIDTEEKELRTVLDNFKQKGITLISLEIPKESLQISICKKYKKVRVFWPIDGNGELVDVTPIFLPIKTLNENYTDPAKEIVKKAYNELPLTRKKTLANKFADYSFQIPFGRCNT
jgi:hypothetical protein